MLTPLPPGARLVRDVFIGVATHEYAPRNPARGSSRRLG
jgi:hypothetical protein